MTTTVIHSLNYDLIRVAGAAGSFDLVDPRGIPPGGGGPGPGPFPPPAPLTGGRLYGCYSLPARGAGYWNCTIAQITPGNATALLNVARDSNMRLMLITASGENSDWGKPFSFAKYEAAMRKMAGNAALDDAIADGTAVANYLLDEGNNVDRYGKTISRAEHIDMVQLSDELWPGWATVFREDPSMIGGPIPGLSWTWAQYKPSKDPSPSRFITRAVAAAQDIGTLLVTGLNTTDYHGGNGNANNSPSNWATPAEYRAHGTILANADPNTVVGFIDWRFQSAPSWYDVSGMPQAVLDVRTIFRALDP